LQNYISREDRDYFNTLTQEICDSVVNSGGAQEEGEEQGSEASASSTSGKRKRAVKPREDEANGVREAILGKMPKPTNSARPVQHVQRSGRVSRKPVFLESIIYRLRNTLNGNRPSWSFDPEPAQPVNLWFYAGGRKPVGVYSALHCA
jgi:hypothetical protein